MATIIDFTKDHSIKVKELRELLANIPEKFDECIVESDGCDCVGDAVGLEVYEYESGQVVLILKRR